MHACADGSDGDINFSWEIMGLDEHNRTHTFSEVLTRTCAELLGEPLMNVSVVNVMGRQLSKGDSGSYSSYPRRYLRFSLFYDPESSTGPSYVDVVRDGQIDVYDVVAVTGMYGLDIESTTNWTDINYYDVTGDGSIDIYDIVAVSNHYGKSVHYLLPIDPRNVLAKFYYANGTLCSESNLDIEGCVVFPEQARTVKLYNGSEGILVRGMYEEFGDLYEEEKTTDFLGLSESSSSPTAKGVHLVQTKVCSSFEAIQVRFGLDLNANRTVVCDRLSLLQYFCVVRNPTSLDLSHSPRNATGAASVTVIAYLVDEFRSKPISNALIEFELYKKMGNDEELVADYDESTNSSGVALFCFEPSSFRYRVEARFSENETFFGSSGSVYVDARIFTQLNITVDIDGDGTLETLIGSNSFFADLGVGIPYEFEAEVIPEQGPNGPMGTIRVYVNGDSYANISHSDHFFWTAQTEGAYDFRMFYEGDDETRPCEWKFVVDVEVLPLLVYFDATPRKFKPGDIISLHALAVVANTNQTFAAAAHYTTQLAMLGYGALLSIFCLIAYDLYKSGAILKAKAFLGTLVIDLWGTALSTCLPLSTAVIFDAVVFNILGVVASNLIEPLSLKAALITANGVLLAGLTIGLASLLIPEPTSITFRLWFQVITLLFSAFALGILLAW